MKPRMRFRCEANYCTRWATTHVDVQERVMGGRRCRLELCDMHTHRLMQVNAGEPLAVHIRHLVA